MSKRTVACVGILCFASSSLACAFEDGTQVRDEELIYWFSNKDGTQVKDWEFINLFANVEKRKIESKFNEVYKKFIESFPTDADLYLNFQRIEAGICLNGNGLPESTKLRGRVFHPALCLEFKRVDPKEYFWAYLNKRVNERVDYIEKNDKYSEFDSSFDLWYGFFKFLLDLTPNEFKDFGKSLESKFSADEIQDLVDKYFGEGKIAPWYYSDFHKVEHLLIARRYLKEHNSGISSASVDSVWSRFWDKERLLDYDGERISLRGKKEPITPKDDDKSGENHDSNATVDPGNNNGSQNDTRGKEKETDPSGNFESDRGITSGIASYFIGGLVTALFATFAWFKGWFSGERDARTTKTPSKWGYVQDTVF